MSDARPFPFGEACLKDATVDRSILYPFSHQVCEKHAPFTVAVP